MTKKFALMTTFGIISMLLTAFGISQEQLSPRERAERRAADIQRQQEALFGGKLPPGTVTVIGRAAMHSNREGHSGLANSVTLLEAAKNPNIQKELGLTDAQITQMQSARTDLQLQTLMLAPKYINRFKTMTDTDHDTIQEELQKEIEAINKKINERVDGIVTPEQKVKARTLVFQSIGGIDSPLIGMDSLDTLNLTDAQKEKAKAVFQEMEAERFAQAEEGFKLLEKAIEKGGVNMSEEDRQAFEEEGRALRSRVMETGQKIGNSLRTFLTPEQLDLEKRLMAARPGFLPPLPHATLGQMMDQYYVPGLNSWRPGQPLPEGYNVPEQQRSRSFPRTPAKN